MSLVWDERTILDTEATASQGEVVALELPSNAQDVTLQVNQSGTASVITCQVGQDGLRWKSLFTMVGTSATLHSVTTVPRYFRAFTSGTADAHIVVGLQFRKPV